jgi:glycosyltransferase involved in cell wall biosynthesis
MEAGTPLQLSVVVPVYGCRGCVEPLHRRLVAVIEQMGVEAEIILVDDRSPDGSWELLEPMARRDPRTVAIRLSRNFGQHAAITAGLERARGERVVVMDCDLQDPPEEIPRLYAKALEGFEIVYARRKRTGTSPFRRATARLYFKLMNVFAKASFDQAGSFSIISRQVVDEFLRFRDRDRHYILILHWLGFTNTTIDYEQSGRHEGSSSYGIRGLLSHALSGLFFQTTVLLRWIVYMGFALSAAGLLFAVYVIVVKLTGSAAPGFASLAVFTLTIGGFIIVSTGVTGLYIGRVFDQVRERPLFVIDIVAGEGDAREQVSDRGSALSETVTRAR